MRASDGKKPGPAKEFAINLKQSKLPKKSELRAPEKPFCTIQALDGESIEVNRALSAFPRDAIGYLPVLTSWMQSPWFLKL
jgi:hypothetical protein